MRTQSWVDDYLAMRSVPHTMRTHPSVFSSSDLAEVEAISPSRVAKVVVSVDDTKVLEDDTNVSERETIPRLHPLLLVVPASKTVDLETARRELGRSHLRLATENEMADMFPDCEVGAVPPLNRWDGVPVVVDDAGFSKDELLIQAANHEEAALLNYEDWVRLVRPKVAHFSVPRRGAPRLSMRGLVFFLAGVTLLLFATMAFVTVWERLRSIGWGLLDWFSIAIGLSVSAAIGFGILCIAWAGGAAFLAVLIWALYFGGLSQAISRRWPHRLSPLLLIKNDPEKFRPW